MYVGYFASCVSIALRDKRALDPLDLGLQIVVSCLVGARTTDGMGMGCPLQEQQVFSTTEPSLQPCLFLVTSNKMASAIRESNCYKLSILMTECQAKVIGFLIGTGQCLCWLDNHLNEV